MNFVLPTRKYHIYFGNQGMLALAIVAAHEAYKAGENADARYIEMERHDYS